MSKIYSLVDSYKLIIINGGLEIKDQSLKNIHYNSCEKYYQLNSTILTVIEFINSTKVSIINGGITKEMKEINLIESLFVKNIDEKPWHKSYKNKFGYIISNNPISEEINYYSYSAQIGCINKVYGQEVDQYGLQNTILI